MGDPGREQGAPDSIDTSVMGGGVEVSIMLGCACG